MILCDVHEAGACPPGCPDARRDVIVHLSVSVPAIDVRNAGQIADAITAALQVGIEGGFDHVGALRVECPLAEEV